MQDSSHLTIILCSRVIKIVISQKQKFNRKNNNNYYYILSRDSEVTLSHWSRSIELVIMPLIDL
jgi:hypothetical protein